MLKDKDATLGKGITDRVLFEHLCALDIKKWMDMMSILEIIMDDRDDDEDIPRGRGGIQLEESDLPFIPFNQDH